MEVAVKAEEGTQLLVEQPIDLMLRTGEGPVQIVIDGFEFGKETFTILAAGKYRIEVRPVTVPTESAWTFSMSRRQVSLQEGQVWRQAEIYASLSKRTGKPEDIAESLKWWKNLNDPTAVARTHLKQGDASLGANDFTAAQTAYEDALGVCRPLADLRCAAEAANNSGYTAFLLGDLEGSSVRLQEAAEYWSRLALPLYEGQTLSNLGLMFWQSGDFDQALDVLGRARRLLLGRDATAHAQVLNNLGLCYQSLSENERALAYFQPALEVLLARHEAHHAVRVRLNLGRSYMLAGKMEQAQATLELALAESIRIGDSAARADVLNNLGQVLLRRHRAAQAHASLTQALELERSLHSRRGEALALHYLGIEAGTRGDIEAGRDLLSRAAQLRRETGLRDDASESALALAELEYRAGHLERARELVRQAIDLIETVRSKVPNASLRATYYARKRRFFDLLTDIAMGPANSENAAEGFLASEQARARALLDLLTAGGIAAGIPEELVARRTALRSQIGLYALRLSDAEQPSADEAGRRNRERDREEIRRRVELLLNEQDEVEAEIRHAVHASALGRPLASVDELRTALPADTAVLEYYLGERQSYLWLVQPGGIQSFRLPPRAEIEALASRMANEFGAILARRRSPEAQSAFEVDVRRLSTILLGPLAGTPLPQRLVLILDGALYRVPMAALRPPGAREPLGLAHDLIRTPSAAYLLAAKSPAPVSAFPRSVLAIADPVFSAGDLRLAPEVRKSAKPGDPLRINFNGEVRALEALVPRARIQVLRNFDASVASLRARRLKDFALLHFSTHSFIDDGIPELSRVALSLVDPGGRPVDGYLHPYQFAEFRLNRSVVVLSSCETALGKEVLGEGLMGFATSLFSAGASQLVLSLTKVDAEPSAAFFTLVYRRFFGTPAVGMEHALTAARRELARSSRWSDPYYWASFSVVGSLSGVR